MSHLQDVKAPLKGGLLPSVRFRGTLTSIRASVVPELPEKLSNIDYTLEKYKQLELQTMRRILRLFL